MSVAVERHVLPIDLHDEMAWRKALADAHSLLRSPDDLVVLTHTKDQLRGNTALAAALGREQAKAMSDGNKVKLPSGGSLLAQSKLTFQTYGQSRVILACYADDNLMRQVDDAREVTAVIVVPVSLEVISEWINRWNPLIDGRAPNAPQDLIGDGVVETAMKQLTTLINRSSSTFGASDRHQAENTLLILHAKGHTVDAEHLGSWAIKNRWPSALAAELVHVAKKVFDLESATAAAKARKIANGDERYRGWRSQT